MDDPAKFVLRMRGYDTVQTQLLKVSLWLYSQQMLSLVGSLMHTKHISWNIKLFL